MSSRHIVVCGSLNMDIIMTTPRLPGRGETVTGGALSYMEGGKGANQAAAAARLGMRTALVGCVGRDDFGDRLLKSLSGCGVDISRVSRVRQPTGTAVITVEEGGQNTIVVSPGANGSLAAEDILSAKEAIDGAFAAIAQLEVPAARVVDFFRAAKSLGVLTVLDPAPMPAGGIADELMELVDIITPNEQEMLLLTGIFPDSMGRFIEAANILHARGAARVICTCGERGAYYSGDGDAVFQPAYKVKAVDATCAGDSFTAAFVYMLERGSDIRDALDFAARAAAIAVTRLGAQESLPTLEQIARFAEA